jgi:hypothetical protein
MRSRMKTWLMEHRWGERIRVDFPVRLVTRPFSKRDGRLTDLSVSGASIHTHVLIRPRSRLEVTLLASPWARHEAVVVSAFVTRRYRQGVGIEWCEFAPAPVGSLLHSVARRPHAFSRRPASRASVTIARLSGSLLKHPSDSRCA